MNSFISWIGGKKLLRNQIISRFPQGKFNRYVEVFGGAAWVLFAKDQHAKFEVYNDINGDLVNLFRCVKYHCEELQRELSFYLNSREMFFDCKNQLDSSGLTDIQRAARYFVLIRISYGSDRRTYGCAPKSLVRVTEELPAIQKRLSKVVIESRDFARIIKVYDRPDTLFYLDPPYHGTEKYYDGGFDDECHQKLRQVLGQIKGLFLLSYNDDEYIRDLYKPFMLEELVRNNNLTAGSQSNRVFRELLIRNF